MKISFVDFQYDYGKKERGINHMGEYGFMKAMRNLGHEVVPFFIDNYLTQIEQLQIDLIAFAKEHKPDLFFFQLYTNQFKPETLKELNKISRTLNWFGDDSWRFDNFTKDYAGFFSHCVTTDKWSLPKYKNLGFNHVIFSQWAAMEYPLKESSNTYLYDVSFIGGAHPVRKWFIGELIKEGIAVQTFGTGWPNGSISMDQMYDVMKRSKINLNLSNSRTLDLRYLLKNPKNLYYSWIADKIGGQMKARNFEIPYAGGFQLAEYVPGVEDYLDLSREIVCYATLEDCITMIKYYLNHDLEREEICRKSQERTKNCHTFTHRLAHVLAEVQKRS